ncbi:MAG: DUF2975 domain-containing protein [Desulfovibrio sp.]|nr:DUF2975 domain-containing protein [Desulfovibrio sp.]
MDNLGRIRSVSRTFRTLCTALMVLLPLGLAVYWFFLNDLPKSMLEPLPAAPSVALGPGLRLLGFLATMIPCGVLLYAVWRLRRLFSLYMAGRIFGPENVACYRGLGKALLLWAGASFVQTPLLSIIATLPNPPGTRLLMLGVGSGELGFLFLGSLVLVVSWVMDEGRKLDEEQALTV